MTKGGHIAHGSVGEWRSLGDGTIQFDGFACCILAGMVDWARDVCWGWLMGMVDGDTVSCCCLEDSVCVGTC